MKEFILVNNLYFSYKNIDQKHKYVLKDINLSIKKGDFVVFMGLNGSGKSTLAKMFNGLLLPDSGEVIIDGMNTRDINHIWDIRKLCGYVFQNPDNQLVASVVEEDVAFGPENLGFSREKIIKKINESLEIVEMSEHKDALTYKLSGGQKQRVAIASILAMEPECIVFDEPTSMLDPKGRKEVMRAILKLNKEKGKTIILITHNIEEIMYADRVFLLDKGMIILEDKPLNIINNETFLKMGFEMPAIFKLALLLKQHGLNISDNIWTVDEMERELCLLKSKM
ncbi:energy-coupling factor transporter ATPase [Caldicellulosiruptoraceae bacterium PP1]